MSVESELKKLTEAINNLTESLKSASLQSPSAPNPGLKATPKNADAAVADIFGQETASEPAASVPPSTPAPTIDDVKVTLKAFMDKKGDAETLALLQKFGVQRITELKEEDYAKVIAAAAV